jgi:hypothetical protein
MVLGEPYGIHTQVFCSLDLIERLLERLCLRHVWTDVKISEHPELHTLSPFAAELYPDIRRACRAVCG